MSGGCRSCGALGGASDPHAFQKCLARNVVCQRCGMRGHFTMLCTRRKNVVAPPTQTHKGLPVRSWLRAPGTPYNQMVRYLSEDPTRADDALAEVRKWRKFLKGLRNDPVDLAILLREDGRRRVAWWRRFFENDVEACMTGVGTRCQ